MSDVLIIYDKDGKVVDRIKDFTFIKEINFAMIKQVVEWQMCNKRSGMHQTRNVSIVNGTTAKPYRQKGTGMARQGSLRSNQFRSGGVVFGSNIRDYNYKLNKKIRVNALLHAFSFLYLMHRLIIIDSFKDIAHKTKDVLNIFSKIDVLKDVTYSNRVIFVGENMGNLQLAVRNLKYFNVLKYEGLNVYDIIMSNFLVIDRASINLFLNISDH